MNSTALFVFCFLCLVASAFSCGCYGPSSCDLNNNLVGQCGYCDCCPVCNTCLQLFSGCHASQMQSISFSPAVPSTIIVQQPVSFQFTGPGSPFISVCVTPDLPAGLSIQSDNNGNFFLQGNASEIVPPTTFTFITKGSVEILGTTQVTFAVSPGCQGCTLGYQQCSSPTTYQTCVYGTAGSNTWDNPQNCPVGTSCYPYQGNYILCGFPSP